MLNTLHYPALSLHTHFSMLQDHHRAADLGECTGRNPIVVSSVWASDDHHYSTSLVSWATAKMEQLKASLDSRISILRIFQSIGVLNRCYI